MSLENGKQLAEEDSIRFWQQHIHDWAKGRGWYDCMVCQGKGVLEEPIDNWTDRAMCGECAGTGKQQRNLGEMMANIHSELSEAWEFWRKDNCGFAINEVFSAGYRDDDGKWIEVLDRKTGLPKPDGFAVEIADTVIRLLDLCGYLEIDLARVIAVKMEYNERRGYRHGNLRA